MVSVVGVFSAKAISIQQRKHGKSRCPNIATCRMQSATCCNLIRVSASIGLNPMISHDIQWSILTVLEVKLTAFILKSQSKSKHSGNKRADPESNNSSWSIEFHSYPILSLFYHYSIWKMNANDRCNMSCSDRFGAMRCSEGYELSGMQTASVSR